ncbi:hypothetical protein [Arthrobacter sp. ISL-69]|uniref:hypothetical protein n=1 Tax=Arthrobacter sp. ISL-69 TaxID=2819113 RepID=UPI001BECB4AE|nr:hypothetical protein [Arthrobacter sp. ISL-69]MBT2538944.1 hypothetical protein [Arthrobacter sp. ISL-69]
MPTDDSLACAQARTLATEHPQQALDLIDKIRGSYAPQEGAARTNCADERNFALQRLGETQQAANTATPTPPVEPRQAQTAWDKYWTSWVSPWQTLALTGAGAVLAMIILARLLAFLPGPWMPLRWLDWKHRSRALRRTAFWAGLILMVGPTLQFVTLLALSQRPAATPAPGTPPDPVAPFSPGASLGLGTLPGLLALSVVGSLLFATWIASRPRLSIVVKDKSGAVNESMTSYIIALLAELGAAAPKGIEVPRGADATGLADASVSAEISNKVLAALSKALLAVVGLTTWKVVVDSATDNDLSVVITRNGWSVKATTISTSNHLLFPTPAAKTSTPAPEDASPDKDSAATGSAPASELHKLAAAFVVATLAEHEQGFEGLCGATDWRSIGLQYLATTGHALEEVHQKLLLANAVNVDPENLLASTALMNILHRKGTTPGPLTDYETWLDRTIEKIDKTDPLPPAGKAESGATDKPAGTEKAKVTPVRRNAWTVAAFEGHRALLYRLELTRLSVGMNRMAAVASAAAAAAKAKRASNSMHRAPTPDGQSRVIEQGRSQEDYVKLAKKLIRRLSDPRVPHLELEKRLRPHIALIFLDLQGDCKEDPLDPETAESWSEWRDEALKSPSPTIAYSAACSYARLYARTRDEDPRADLAPIWGDIQRRLNIATLDADISAWVTEDPELCLHLKGSQDWEKYTTALAGPDTPKPKGKGLRQIREDLEGIRYQPRASGNGKRRH